MEPFRKKRGTESVLIFLRANKIGELFWGAKP
jgi:hypothetical protein